MLCLQEAQRLAAAERKVTAARSELLRCGREASDAGRAHTRQLAEAQNRADSLADENTSLLLDLNSRPTQKDQASLSRQIDVLQQKLRRAECGDAAAAGESALPQQTTQQATKLRTTRERIARDKKVAVLGLHGVERVPRDVLVELVQDACVALDVSDATALPAAVLRLLRAAAVVPQMEGFVNSVCESVFRQGAALLPRGLTQRDPGSVVKVRQRGTCTCSAV
jgi:hypothetical protein